jgi:peptide/nickel transport system substrate-binding protein
MLAFILTVATAAVPQQLTVAAGPDTSPSGAFQARLGVYPLNVNVAEPLVRLTPDYRVEPQLATSWEYLGKNTWRFHLRKGVKFHDGQPLTAEAVRWSIAQQIKGGFTSFPLNEDAVRVVDPLTVDFTTTEPHLRLPEQLVHPNYSIFAPGSDPRTKPVGTGPLRFVEYKSYDHISVRRNDDYWGKKARLERITFRFLPDSNTRVLALLAGEVDFLMDVPREQVAEVQARPGLQLVRASVGQMLSLQLNAHGKPPYSILADRSVRRAIAVSIDRRQLVHDVWRDEAQVLRTMTVPAILGRFADRLHGFDFDPAQADRLLNEAGWKREAGGIRSKGGRPLQLTMIANPEMDAATVELMQAQLRSTGMDVRWDRLPDVASFAARGNAGECDLNLAAGNQNDANPLFLPALIYYSKSPRPFVRWYAVGDAFDKVVDAGLAAPDPDEARRLAAEAMRLATDEEAIQVPIAGLFRIYAASSSVAGFVPHPSQTNQSWTAVYRK